MIGSAGTSLGFRALMPTLLGGAMGKLIFVDPPATDLRRPMAFCEAVGAPQ